MQNKTSTVLSAASTPDPAVVTYGSTIPLRFSRALTRGSLRERPGGIPTQRVTPSASTTHCRSLTDWCGTSGGGDGRGGDGGGDGGGGEGGGVDGGSDGGGGLGGGGDGGGGLGGGSDGGGGGGRAKMTLSGGRGL